MDIEEIFNKFNIDEPVVPQIPIIPSQGEIAAQKISAKLTNVTETIRKNNLISEMDKLNYELKQKQHEKEKLTSRKKAIEKNNSMKNDVLIFKNISIFSIVIPFILKITLATSDNNLLKFGIVTYIIVSFLFSMNKMYNYLKK